MPSVREEGDTLIVPIVEEAVVVERRLVVKEEIHVRRIRRTENYEERVKVRKQEAVVTRSPMDGQEATDASVAKR
jgi:stress response protein YsnF